MINRALVESKHASSLQSALRFSGSDTLLNPANYGGRERDFFAKALIPYLENGLWRLPPGVDPQVWYGEAAAWGLTR